MAKLRKPRKPSKAARKFARGRNTVRAIHKDQIQRGWTRTFYKRGGRREHFVLGGIALGWVTGVDKSIQEHSKTARRKGIPAKRGGGM